MLKVRGYAAVRRLELTGRPVHDQIEMASLAESRDDVLRWIEQLAKREKKDYFQKPVIRIAMVEITEIEEAEG